MATNVVEQIIIELGLDTSKFAVDAEKASKMGQELAKSLSDTEKASKKTEKAQDELSKKQHDAIEQIAKMGQGFAKATKELTKLFGVIIGSTGLFKLANDAARANLEMSKLSGQLGMSTKSLTDWQNAAGAFGGNAQGMTASLTGIKQAMNGLVMFGDASMLPYFNALGVSVVNNAGKVRQLDDVMLDLADAFQKMPQDQAYTLGKKMGFDDGTINMLVSGRKEMQEILTIQNQMYHSDQKAIAQSKELIKQQAILSAHWQSMKQMVGDALTPVLIGLIKIVNGFFEFLQRHEKVVTTVFKVAAVVIGMLLIPTLLSATRTLLGFIAPFTPLIKVFGLLGAAISPVTLLITALSAAVVLLYDDYKTWSEGGKSLFDWSSFSAGIKECKLFVDALSDSFANMARAFSDMAISMIASVTGENVDDISGFIGESVYRLMHGGKTFEEVEGVGIPAETNAPVNAPTQNPSNAQPASNVQTSTGAANVANKARAAAQYATRHAKGASIGKCALFVNNSLRAQGIKIWGHGKSVAGNLLKRNDFQQVLYDANYVPQVGDIMSIPPIPGHPYGHVAIWNGYQWVSDFKQQRKRGNTAAPADSYYAAIKAGRIKPVIARMKSTDAASTSNLVKNASQTKKQAVTNINQDKVPVSGNNRTIAALIKTQGTKRIYEMTDGSIETRDGGTVAWRNNNPGNFKFGYHGSADKTDKSRRSKEQALKDAQRRYKGVVALDQWGNAIFATVELGKQAKIKLLTGTHKNRTVSEMLRKYAVNDYSGKTHYGNYEKLIYQAGAKYGVNLKDKTIGQMSALELRALEEGMERAEGIKEGKISISKKNLMAQQAEKAKKMVNTSQQQSINNSKITNDNRKHVNVNINNVNVNTSAKTVSGNVVAAVKGVNNYMINQLGTPMT